MKFDEGDGESELKLDALLMQVFNIPREGYLMPSVPYFGTICRLSRKLNKAAYSLDLSSLGDLDFNILSF